MMLSPLNNRHVVLLSFLIWLMFKANVMGQRLEMAVPLSIQTEKVPTAFAMSPDGQIILAAVLENGHKPEIVTWNGKGQYLYRITIDCSWIEHLCIAPDGKTFSATCVIFDEKIRLMPYTSEILHVESTTGKVLRSWKQPGMHCGSAAFTPDGQTLGVLEGKAMAGSFGSLVKLFTIRDGVEQITIEAVAAISISFSSEGHLLVGMSNGQIYQWNRVGWKPKGLVATSDGMATSWAFSTDGLLFAVAGTEAEKVMIYDMPLKDMQRIELPIMKRGRHYLFRTVRT
jgi:WD40 repeat protein